MFRELWRWMMARRTGNSESVPVDANHTARVIAAANRKGGVGKTTTAVNVAAGLAYLEEKRVLLIDLDPQGNASISLGVDIEDLEYSVKDLLTGKITDFQRLLWDKGENLKILPSNSSLTEIEPALLSSIDGRKRFRERIKPILSQFDYIIIDTAPTTGVLTQSALIAADEVIVPVDVGYLSIQGIKQLLGEIEQVRMHENPDLVLSGVLLTKFDSRTKLSQQVEDVLRRSFPKEAFKTVIRVNIDLIRCQIDRKSIFATEPTSTGAQDYRNLIDEILKRQKTGKIIPLRIRRN
jgi:chromosome partitioning protein